MHDITDRKQAEQKLQESETRIPGDHESRNPHAAQCSDRHGGLWQLTFAVSDSGIGMDEATQKRLFQPFVQADSFHLVFMDMQMPVMDGLTATRHIHESIVDTRQRPVIVALFRPQKLILSTGKTA